MSDTIVLLSTIILWDGPEVVSGQLGVAVYPVILATRETMQEGCKFEASLDNLVRLSQIRNRTGVAARW